MSSHQGLDGETCRDIYHFPRYFTFSMSEIFRNVNISTRVLTVDQADGRYDISLRHGTDPLYSNTFNTSGMRGRDGERKRRTTVSVEHFYHIRSI